MSTEDVGRSLKAHAPWFIALYLGFPVAGALCVGALLLTHSMWPVRVFLVLAGCVTLGRLAVRWRTGLLRMMFASQRRNLLRVMVAAVLILQVVVACFIVVVALRL